MIEWCEWNRGKWPALDMIYHIPNGKERDPRTAAILKGLGVKPGVLDLCLPVARRGFHGFYLEMKWGENKTSDAQEWWIKRLHEEGYHIGVCYSADVAIQMIEWYMNGERTRVVAL